MRSQIDGIIGEDEREPSGVQSESADQTLRISARDLAASLNWLPGRPSSEVFSQRCEALSATFESLFDTVEDAFTKAPTSEDLIWLRNNAHQMSSAARATASELGSVATVPVVSDKAQILPRVL